MRHASAPPVANYPSMKLPQMDSVILVTWNMRGKHKSLARKYSYNSLAIALVMHVWSYEWSCANSLTLNAAGGADVKQDQRWGPSQENTLFKKINWSDLRQRFDCDSKNLFFFSFLCLSSWRGSNGCAFYTSKINETEKKNILEWPQPE